MELLIIDQLHLEKLMTTAEVSAEHLFYCRELRGALDAPGFIPAGATQAGRAPGGVVLDFIVRD